MTDVHAITVTVAGRVHGVGFRYSTQRAALELGLSGWVRNQPDGTVSTRAQGPAEAIRRLVSFLEQGPPAARVTSIEVADTAVDPTLEGFRVRY